MQTVSSEVSVPFMNRLDTTQISGLAKEMAPIVASLVVRELLQEGGGVVAAPRKTTNKRGVRLKDAMNIEKKAEDSKERNMLLVSSVHLNHRHAHKTY